MYTYTCKIYMYVYKECVCTCVSVSVHVFCECRLPQRPEGGVEYPGAGLTGWCEPPDVVPNLGPLQEQWCF